MQKGIMRIPTEGNSLEFIVHAELGSGVHSQRELGEVITELYMHSRGNADHIACTLDWAMQIRERMGIDWATCIDISMTLYFG